MPQEDLSSFLEWIYQADHWFAAIDVEAGKNLKMINVTFISQHTPDIWRKLQKEGSFRNDSLGIDMNCF